MNDVVAREFSVGLMVPDIDAAQSQKEEGESNAGITNRYDKSNKSEKKNKGCVIGSTGGAEAPECKITATSIQEG